MNILKFITGKFKKKRKRIEEGGFNIYSRRCYDEDLKFVGRMDLMDLIDLLVKKYMPEEDKLRSDMYFIELPGGEKFQIRKEDLIWDSKIPIETLSRGLGLVEDLNFMVISSYFKDFLNSVLLFRLLNSIFAHSKCFGHISNVDLDPKEINWLSTMSFLKYKCEEDRVIYSYNIYLYYRKDGSIKFTVGNDEYKQETREFLEEKLKNISMMLLEYFRSLDKRGVAGDILFKKSIKDRIELFSNMVKTDRISDLSQS